MDCCWFKAVLVMLSLSIMLCGAQHFHHGHPSRLNLNSIDNKVAAPQKIDDKSTSSKQSHPVNSDVGNNLDVPHANSGPALIVGTSNNSAPLPQVIQAKEQKESPVVARNHTHPHNYSSNNVECVCALFTMKSPIELDVPLLSKTFYNVSCHGHASGEDACSQVCISFTKTQYKSPNHLICSVIRNATDVTGFLHSKMCQDKAAWTFTGLQNTNPLCCNEGEVAQCENKTPRPAVI